MKLKIIAIHGHGDAKNERVIMQATEDCDLRYYVLWDTTYTEKGRVSKKWRHPYWFPHTEVKAGEYVSLWTKEGKNVKGTMTDGEPVHRFFWNLKEAVWNDDGDCGVLIEISDWQTTIAK